MPLWFWLILWAAFAWWTFRGMIRLVYESAGEVSRGWFFTCIYCGVVFPIGLIVLWVDHMVNRPPRQKPDYTNRALRLAHLNERID